MSALAFYDSYVLQGLKIIPLKENTKVPVTTNWNKHWNATWARDIVADSNSNLGLLLGSIIDVEGDTKQANKIISNLTRDYPHPMYASSKSIHHLFLNPDPTITIVKLDGIEFRGQRHHSVLPPSIHPDGTEYTWLNESRFPIPKMPYSLLSLLKKARKVKNRLLKPDRVEPYCPKCEEQVFVHKKRFHLELLAFKALSEIWTCRKCRTVDIRSACREIRTTTETSNACCY